MRRRTRRLGLVALGLLLLTGGSCGRRPAFHVVLLGIDTLRADALSCLASGRSHTPRFDHLAREGLLFRRAISTANWTLPSFATLLTGWLPEAHGAYTPRERLPQRAETLAELLRARGYRTAAYTSGGYVHRRFGLDQGFEIFDDEAGSGHLRDKIGDALQWARAQAEGGEPFFLFLHGYDVHAPYSPSVRPDPPPGYIPPGPDLVRRFVVAVEQGADLGRFDPGRVLTAYLTIEPPGVEMLARFRRAFDRWSRQLPVPVEELWRRSPDFAASLEWVRRNYDREVEELDHDVEGLLRFVLDPARRRDTVLVVVSDHGEAFLEHGRTEHTRLDEEVLHVPLLVLAPGLEPGVVDDPVSTVDVPATILALAGFEGRLGNGRSLLERPPSGETRPLFAFRHTVEPGQPVAAAVRLGALKGRTGGERGHAWALYDLANDPLETRDVASDHPEVVATMRDRLDRVVASCRAVRLSLGRENSVLDEEARRELEELGYLGVLGEQ